MRHRWNIASTSRHSSTGGDTMPIAVRCVLDIWKSQVTDLSSSSCTGAIKNQNPGEAPRTTAAGGRGDRDVPVRHFYDFSKLSSCKHRFPECDKISPPCLQLSGISFGYTPDNIIIKNADIDVGLDSRIAVVGSNGAGKWVAATYRRHYNTEY